MMQSNSPSAGAANATVTPFPIKSIVKSQKVDNLFNFKIVVIFKPPVGSSLYNTFRYIFCCYFCFVFITIFFRFIVPREIRFVPRCFSYWSIDITRERCWRRQQWTVGLVFIVISLCFDFAISRCESFREGDCSLRRIAISILVLFDSIRNEILS